MEKLKKFIGSKKALPTILIVAFAIRLIWILVVKTVPTSDFKLMYITAQEAAKGDFTAFRGHAYFHLFPHDNITVLYFSLFFKFMKNPLFLIKFMNVIYETFAVYMIYLIGKNTYNEKIGKIAGILLTFFPPFIMYTSETMAENMAIPLFLISIYCFLKYIDNDKLYMLFISGAFLSMGDLFRPVGEVFFIAYIIYYIIKKVIQKKKNYGKKVLGIIIFIIACILPTFLISNILVSSKVLENQIWQPAEPAIMTVLKGVNFQSTGAWTVEDANLPRECDFNKQLIQEKAKNIIIQRLKTHSIGEIVELYAKKTLYQWGIGDFGAYGWTVLNNQGMSALQNPRTLIISIISYIIITIYYLFLIVMAVIGLFKLKRHRNSKVLFYYLILLGFIGFYLLTERQARYAFVCSWIFTLIAANGFYKPEKTIH